MRRVTLVVAFIMLSGYQRHREPPVMPMTMVEPAPAQGGPLADLRQELDRLSKVNDIFRLHDTAQPSMHILDCLTGRLDLRTKERIRNIRAKEIRSLSIMHSMYTIAYGVVWRSVVYIELIP